MWLKNNIGRQYTIDDNNNIIFRSFRIDNNNKEDFKKIKDSGFNITVDNLSVHINDNSKENIELIKDVKSDRLEITIIHDITTEMVLDFKEYEVNKFSIRNYGENKGTANNVKITSLPKSEIIQIIGINFETIPNLPENLQQLTIDSNSKLEKIVSLPNSITLLQITNCALKKLTNCQNH